MMSIAVTYGRISPLLQPASLAVQVPGILVQRPDSFLLQPRPALAQAPKATGALRLFAGIDSDPTMPKGDSPEGAGAPPSGGANSGGGGFGFGALVTAYDVHLALISIPMRRSVILDDWDMANHIVRKGWVEWITDQWRVAIKSRSSELPKLEMEFAALSAELKLNSSPMRRIRSVAESIREGIRSLFSRPTTITLDSAPQAVPVTTVVIKTMKARVREIESEISQARIADEWHRKRVAWTHHGYLFLTDTGQKVMEALDRVKDDPEMRDTHVDDYLELIGADIK